MKRNLLFVLLLALSSSLFSQQTIYVKHDAGGANNGTSWADAYTTLDPALGSAMPGDQVWVAAGTYKPDAGTANNSFAITAGVQLYGGFNGTESMLSARNPATNVTTLSGDLAGDDVAGNFVMNRTDNSRHVIITLTGSSPTDRAIIDGFTIRNGHTLEGATNPDLMRRGGGILATELLTVSNCQFTANFGDSGSGIAAVGLAASGVLIDNCLFENNVGSQAGAGIFLRDLLSGDVNKCILRNNITNRGCLYVLTSANVNIDSCLVEMNSAPGNFSAGLFTFTTQTNVTNTIIRGNTASRATAWYNDGRDGGDMLTVNNCIIENNEATTFGAGFYNWQGTYSIKNTIFRNNEAPSAGGLYSDGREFDSNFSIDSCLFENNTTSDYGGSAMYAFKANYEMTNCTFKGNTAPSSAAALYNGDTTVFLIQNCLFESNSSNYGGAIANYGAGLDGTYDQCTFKGNTATSSGGAMNIGFTAMVHITNSVFEENSSPGSGGAIRNQNEFTDVYVSNTRFELNSAAFGGVAALYGQGNDGIYTNCTFLNNTAETSGGALINGFLAHNKLDSCYFEGNAAGFGAAVFCQNDSTEIEILNSTFFGNNAENNGGAVNISAGIPFSIENTRFELNTADFGGALEISEDSLDLTVGTINNCIFQENFALTQGAGLNLNDADVTISNCLIMKNVNIGDGAGGGLINNATENKTAPVKIINSTIADNAAVIGAGIAQWENDNGGVATIELQNTILYNQSTGGLDYEVEAGNPEVISNGGNLAGDFTLNAELVATNDQTELDPMFVDADFYNYHLKAGSPCIDKGIATGAPATDLEGNARVGEPDQGCYEYQTSATHSPKANVLPIRLMPNPVVERAIMVIESEVSGDARVQMVAQNGAVVRSFNTVKPAGRWAYPIEARDLPAGVYSVQVYLGSAFYEGSFVKQ